MVLPQSNMSAAFQWDHHLLKNFLSRNVGKDARNS